MFSSDLTAFAKCPSLESLKRQKRVSDEIRHIKCPIIKLVKRQIESAEQNITNSLGICERSLQLERKQDMVELKSLLFPEASLGNTSYGAIDGPY